MTIEDGYMDVYKFLNDLFNSTFREEKITADDPLEWFYVINSLQESAVKKMALAALYFSGIYYDESIEKAIIVLKEGLIYEYAPLYQVVILLDGGYQYLGCKKDISNFLSEKERSLLIEKYNILKEHSSVITSRYVRNVTELMFPPKGVDEKSFNNYINNKKIENNKREEEKKKAYNAILESKTKEEFEKNFSYFHDTYIKDIENIYSKRDLIQSIYDPIFNFISNNLACYSTILLTNYINDFGLCWDIGVNQGYPKYKIDFKFAYKLIFVGKYHDDEIINYLYHYSHETDIKKTDCFILILYSKLFDLRGDKKLSQAYLTAARDKEEYKYITNIIQFGNDQ